MEPIWEYIKNCKNSLFRFEGLQDYSEEDGAKWVEIFTTTGKLAELPDERNEWWKEMKERNEKGLLTQRVRLVTKPMTDYTKMELAYLKEAKKYSGDDIRIIDEKSFNELMPNGLKDFWIIDDTYVFLMEYSPKGKYLKSQLVEDVKEYVRLKDRLLEASFPI